MECAKFDPFQSRQQGVIVQLRVNYFAPVAFPMILDLALRVNKIGNTSVTYEIGLFQQEVKAVRAVGTLTQAFVERSTGRPVIDGLSPKLLAALRKLCVPFKATNIRDPKL